MKKMKSQMASTPNGFIEYTLFGSGLVALVRHGTSSNCFSTDVVKPLGNLSIHLF
jgi:hypothetical protein